MPNFAERPFRPGGHRPDAPRAVTADISEGAVALTEKESISGHHTYDLVGLTGAAPAPSHRDGPLKVSVMGGPS